MISHVFNSVHVFIKFFERHVDTIRNIFCVTFSYREEKKSNERQMD
jgi:hypothetical protein